MVLHCYVEYEERLSAAVVSVVLVKLDDLVEGTCVTDIGTDVLGIFESLLIEELVESHCLVYCRSVPAASEIRVNGNSPVA